MAEAIKKQGTEARRTHAPSVDVIEKDNDYILVADMPGVDENSVDVTLEKDLLTIHGRVQHEIPEDYKPILSEYEVCDYKRSFTISEEIDRDRIQATVKDGVLRLILPKAEGARARKIPVVAGA
jgi:HSP20 family molecular chaperone IbpA